jgi:hypothetical protein
MRQIPATKGYVILCDDEDYRRLASFKWYAHNNAGKGRGEKIPRPARRKPTREDPKRQVVFLVHEILGRVPGRVIDHINGDVWDNRRSNLRLCTVAENCRNQRRPRKANGAGKGVYWFNGAWTVKIACASKRYQFQAWDDLTAAELAYDAVALYLHGEFASLNHPDVPTRAKSPEELQAELQARRPSGRVIPYLRAGMTATEAARRAKCSTPTAARVASELGIELTRGRPRKRAA